ncbi:MAG: hypothetical protein ACRC17_00900 [Culicoidibacterales bacterium]
MTSNRPVALSKILDILLIDRTLSTSTKAITLGEAKRRCKENPEKYIAGNGLGIDDE